MSIHWAVGFPSWAESYSPVGFLCPKSVLCDFENEQHGFSEFEIFQLISNFKGQPVNLSIIVARFSSAVSTKSCRVSSRNCIISVKFQEKGKTWQKPKNHYVKLRFQIFFFGVSPSFLFITHPPMAFFPASRPTKWFPTRSTKAPHQSWHFIFAHFMSVDCISIAFDVILISIQDKYPQSD